MLIGEGFSEVPEDNVLVFEGRDEIDAAWTTETARPDQVRGILRSTHKLEFQNVPKAKIYEGSQRLRIRVGEHYSDPPVPITLSRFQAHVPSVAALVVVAFLAFLVYTAAAGGLKPAKVDGERKGMLGTLLLDPETDTYSLSKLQLYSWSAAAIFGYVYLLITRSLIQGRFELVATRCPPLRGLRIELLLLSLNAVVDEVVPLVIQVEGSQ
ncbi:MAG TPA: hypothetical protein VHC22_30700 [Pirellulales bacterium]|nr:hypothetical protein [Pirellulales bacterium]